MSSAIREQIADAIAEGIDAWCDRKEIVGDDGRPETHLHVDGCTDGPIRVLEDDVILPPSLEHIGPGIALDVQAILAQ